MDESTKAFVRHNRSIWRKAHAEADSEILVELYSVSQTLLSFAYFANVLAHLHKSRIVSFSTSRRNSFLFKLRHRALYAVYKSFNTVGHLNSGAVNPGLKRSAERETRKILASLRTKEDILDIEVEGCPIGGDIYEAYLAERLKPTVDVESPDFRGFLEESLRLFYFWSDYIRTHNVKAVILSHGVYMYGIVRRICSMNGIMIYMPSLRSMLCLRNMEENSIPRLDLYREHFRKLPIETRIRGIEWAKKQLDRRLSGEVGVDMQYSTKSAYSKSSTGTRVLDDTGKFKILIATHCFFDNPHCYGRILFPDFYEWLEFLGKISGETDYEWYLKTHPDVLPGNDEVLAGILARYPRIKKLPPTVSHHQLREEGISVVLSVYGSVGHEYPLLGRHVVNAGPNPHIAYDFNHHPKSVEEYRNLLLKLDKLDGKIDPNDVYEFYFMYNKCHTCDRLFLESYSEFTNSLTIEQQNSPAAYRYFMDRFSPERHRALVKMVEDFVASGKYKYFEPEFEVESAFNLTEVASSAAGAQ
jgi:hypothetical protein